MVSEKMTSFSFSYGFFFSFHFWNDEVNRGDTFSFSNISLVMEYQGSGFNPSNPVFEAKSSKNFLLFFHQYFPKLCRSLFQIKLKKNQKI